MTRSETGSEPILAVDAVEKSFGGIRALDGMSFELDEGEITGLIGPNGAGKTTMFNIIGGQFLPDSGDVRYRGRSIYDMMGPDREEYTAMIGTSGLSAGLVGFGVGLSTMTSPVGVGAVSLVAAGAGAALYPTQYELRARVGTHRKSRPYQLSRKGISRTFQITREFSEMTVLENLLIPPHGQTGENLVTRWLRPRTVANETEQLEEQAYETLEFLELDSLVDERAGNLSGGQRKLLELGRVLMTNPDLILLDEPVAGVNPTLMNKLLDRIESLRDDGYTFCIIEHDMDVIMDLSDRVIVMNNGKKLMEGQPEDVTESEAVIDAYLGR
jgi:ABC-type branched-subunit amino acid transport system ATPase component